MEKITRTHKGVYAYIKQDDTILVIKKKRGPYTGLFDLPGGSSEEGESLAYTLAREIEEETLCTLKSYSDDRYIEVYFNNYLEDNGEQGNLYHVGVLFKAEINGVPAENIDDVDSAGAIWVNINDLNKSNSSSIVLEALRVYK